MCGIVGAINTPLQHTQQQQMMQAIRHRGPDDTGLWHDAAHSAFLGHQRLSIVDLSDSGKQPMTNENKTIQMVCNGEIYNFPALRQQLIQEGHFFSSHSDSEIIIHAYEKWGTECVNHLTGMFAFLLWDETKQRLFAARDRVGIKPLYYAEYNQGIVLASEAKAILPIMPTTLNPLAPAYIMTLGYVPSPLTMWHEISKLEAGCFLLWEPGNGITIHRYWSPPSRSSKYSHVNSDEWAVLFSQVLSDHLMADVPISLFLSGGLDSTTLAVGLHELAQQIPAITVRFPGNRYDESPIANEVSRKLKLPHQIINLTVTDLKELLREMALIFDEPQSYSALISMIQICKHAAARFKIVLSGDGGDEIFGGYSWYDDPPKTALSNLKIALKLLHTRLNPRSPAMLPGAKQFAEKSLLHQHAWRIHPRYLPDEAQHILEPLGVEFTDETMIAPLLKHYSPTLPVKRALQRIDLMTFCSDSILPKVDRASMAFGLEIRVPFLDHRLIEWALIQPISKQEQQVSKHILRNYIQNRVPQSVLNHPKQGFSLQILEKFDWAWAFNVISNGYWVRNGYFAKDWQAIMNKNVVYRNARIWNLFILTLWAEQWCL